MLDKNHCMWVVIANNDIDFGIALSEMKFNHTSQIWT